jgi:hypothetical protein
MDIAMGRPGGISAEINGLSQKCIGCPEQASYIMHAPDIIQYQNNRQLI